jgi:methylthioribose-1-phosphate isomerase
MKVHGKHYRTIWLKEGSENIVSIIDQRWLPHKFVVEDLKTLQDFIIAIKEMHIRGAGLIGATAAYAMYITTLEYSKKNGNFDQYIFDTSEKIKATRPTAVNLQWAVDRQLKEISPASSIEERILIAKKTAINIADEDVESCRIIGEYGLKLIEGICKKKNGKTVNILTHCNAGWLAFVDHGTAIAPIYAAYEKGIKVHVWVDETRPRNQGAMLTAWELGMEEIPHTIIADNTGGHLMQHQMVDMVIVGSDRTSRKGDVANKIGTYLKALAAKDNNIPFYVALPSSSIDWNISNGIVEIPIETRGEDELKYMSGMIDGNLKKILIAPEQSSALNIGFDVTPARLVTGLITELGICSADEVGIKSLFPEKKK